MAACWWIALLVLHCVLTMDISLLRLESFHTDERTYAEENGLVSLLLNTVECETRRCTQCFAAFNLRTSKKNNLLIYVKNGKLKCNLKQQLTQS